MITAEGQHHLALLGVVVYLLAEFLGDGACGPWLLHAPVVRIVKRCTVFVVVDGVVIVKFIVQIVAQLVEEAGFD